MTQLNKFEDLNSRFAGLGTGMTQRYKFRDQWTLLLINIQCRLINKSTNRVATKLYKISGSGSTKLYRVLVVQSCLCFRVNDISLLRFVLDRATWH